MFELGRVSEDSIAFIYKGIRGSQSIYGDLVVFAFSYSIYSINIEEGAKIDLSSFCDKLYTLEELSTTFRVPCKASLEGGRIWPCTHFTVEIPIFKVVLYMFKSESKEFQQCLYAPNTLLRRLAREVLEKGDAIRDDYVYKIIREG